MQCAPYRNTSQCPGHGFAYHERRELQAALLCCVDSHAEIKVTRSARRGKVFVWDQLRDDCHCAPLLSLFLTADEKNGLNQRKCILGLCFSNTYFLQKSVLAAHVLLPAMKKALTPLPPLCQNIQSKEKYRKPYTFPLQLNRSEVPSRHLDEARCNQREAGRGYWCWCFHWRLRHPQPNHWALAHLSHWPNSTAKRNSRTVK